MNHVSISPDSQLLVAVGDAPTVFFCRRLPSSQSTSERESDFATCKWQLIVEVRLNGSFPEDSCFATAFSPSGHICAVASQGGVITIFETSMIHQDMDADDAVIDVLKSTRPCEDRESRESPGAVRSMSFGPSPWDLLAWAESRGRICVVDLRDACRSRQTVELDLDSPSLSRVNLSDLENDQSTSEQRQLEIEARFVQRHREALNAQDNLAAISHVTDYMELAAARRRIEREMSNSRLPSEREDFNELTENERLMLESIRTNRLQETGQVRSISTQQSPLGINYLQALNSNPNQSRLYAQIEDSSLNNASTVSPSSRLDSMRDLVRRGAQAAQLERARAAERSTHQPRRRSSIVISSNNGNNNNSGPSQSPSRPSNLAPTGSSASTLSASPSRLGAIATENPTSETSNMSVLYEAGEAWRTISDAMGHAPTDLESEIEAGVPRPDRDRERDVAATGAMLRRMQQQQHQNARLERVRNINTPRLRQMHERTLGRLSAGENALDETELDMLRRLTHREIREGRESGEDGVKTMGLGWNNDGRNL
ncbi:MAG: hypothetical protein Q9214_000800 [Letrouitia sp. 1 TL-2023]